MASEIIIDSAAFSDLQQTEYATSALLVHCEVNPAVTEGFNSQKATDVESTYVCVLTSSCIQSNVWPIR